MTTEKMTVHKALAELKILGDRINHAIVNGVFCIESKHSNTMIKGVSVEEFKKQIQGCWDKASDLIRRRDAIKRAVVLSNAVTKVKVADREMTVAEAIEMKRSGLEYKEALLNALKYQYTHALMNIERANNDLPKTAENYVIGLFGSKEGKTNLDEIEKVRKEFITNNTYELVDPIKIKEKIDTLEKEIANFKAEVDSALSVSNAITEIVVEY